jgi:putative spermidine/putrescine transport system permease protein
MARRTRIVGSPGSWLVWAVVAFFFVNLAGVVALGAGQLVRHEVVRHLAAGGLHRSWYASAWKEFGLLDVVLVTLQVSLLVVVISVLIGCRPSYVLARHDFPGSGS